MNRNDLDRSRTAGMIFVLLALSGAILVAGGLIGFYAPVLLR